MKYLIAIPILIAVIVILTVILLKKKMPAEKFRKLMLLIGVAFSIIAIACMAAAFYISGDVNYVYKSSLPLVILVFAAVQLKRKKSIE